MYLARNSPHDEYRLLYLSVQIIETRARRHRLPGFVARRGGAVLDEIWIYFHVSNSPKDAGELLGIERGKVLDK